MLSIKNPFRRRRTTVIAATANPAVLTVLWQQPDLCIREARSTAGINALLQAAQLVILDPAAISVGDIPATYIVQALAESRIPHTDGLGFLLDPVRWLNEGAAFNGQLRSLPPRVVVFTSLASGGVGKTTLTVGLARSVARRTRLPVAIVELCHGASGFLTILDAPGFSPAPVDAYALATQGGQSGQWRGLTVVPMEGRQGALLTPNDFGALLDRLHGGHVLTIVDAVQPHPALAAHAGRGRSRLRRGRGQPPGYGRERADPGRRADRSAFPRGHQSS